MPRGAPAPLRSAGNRGGLPRGPPAPPRSSAGSGGGLPRVAPASFRSRSRRSQSRLHPPGVSPRLRRRVVCAAFLRLHCHRTRCSHALLYWFVDVLMCYCVDLSLSLSLSLPLPLSRSLPLSLPLPLSLSLSRSLSQPRSLSLSLPPPPPPPPLLLLLPLMLASSLHRRLSVYFHGHHQPHGMLTPRGAQESGLECEGFGRMTAVTGRPSDAMASTKHDNAPQTNGDCRSP